jgi:hypothetical protein
VYVGSTCVTLAERWYIHKCKSKLIHQNTYLYKHVNKLGGWDQFYIELHENYPCTTNQELYRRKGQVQRELKSSLNTTIAEMPVQNYASQLIACECGQSYRRDYINFHRNSKKHKKVMTANIVEQSRKLNERLVEIQTDTR